MANDLKRRIHKAVNRMNAETLEELFWHMTFEGLI